MLMDIMLGTQRGGSRPHLPMVELKKKPHTMEFSGLVAARIISKTSVRLDIFFATSGVCGGRDDHVDEKNATDRPRR